MKKINKITVIFILGLLLFTNCDSFLEEEPKGILQTDNFYNNDREAVLATNGLYRILHRGSLYRTRGLDNYYVNGADLVGPSRNVNGNIHNYLIDEGVADGNGTWGALYEIVRNASDIIARVDGNENLSETIRNQVLGEAYFMRALAYFHLTNLWGDVPYFRELLPIQELSVLTRVSKNIITTDMKADLEVAFNLLPDSYGDAELGRATKAAAKTLQAKYYLFDKEWQLTIDACNEIIDKSPHRLLANFADVFDQTDKENQINEEHIFVVDFTTEGVFGDAGTSRTDDYTPRGSRDEPADVSQRAAFLQDLEDRDEEMTGFAFAIPLPEFADKANWDADDLRYDATIVQEYIGYRLKFPYFRKFWNVTTTSPRFDHHENYIVFRLADVYLMAAEAENELNGPANAYVYVNEVRKRAFDPDKPWSGMTQDSFREAIRDERKFELAAEGHRKMDLIRWGILLDVVKSVQHRPFNNPAANIQEKHLLLPIPQQELLLNPNLLITDPTNNGYR